MSSTQNKKLIYILPEASEKTHMKYNVEFITALAKEKGVDIFLILERGSPDLKNIKEKTGVKNIYYTGTNILRIPKLLLFLSKGFFSGYRKVYIHYSFIGAILSSLNPFFTNYYWNCGLPWNYKRPFLQEIYETFAYKIIDNFVTGTESLALQYSKYYNFKREKKVIIPNWIDVQKTLEIKNHFLTNNKDDLKQELNIQNQKVLFFNQRLVERKGAHYIPTILKSVEEKFGNNFICIITNDGPYKEKLIESLKNNNLLEHTRLLGRVPNERVIELMSITDIYLLPSEEEGMSHSLMEAMCASVATVSFAVGGTLDMYPGDFKEFCVPEKEINKFNEKVIELLKDESKRKILGEAEFEKVKDWDKNKVLNNFVKEVIN